jgi:hypothetical protein
MNSLKFFQDVIPLGENVELKWLLKAVDNIGVLPKGSKEFFSATAAFGTINTMACSIKCSLSQ